MVIECTECHTRFKLADDKVKPGGTKVRCSKCKQIFTVMPPEPAPEPPPGKEEEIDFGEFNMERLAEPGKEPAAAPPAEGPAATRSGGESAETEPGEFSFGEVTKEEFAFDDGEEAAESERFTFGEETGTQPESPAAGRAALDEFAFDDEEEPAESERFAFGEEAGAQPGGDTFGFEESGEFSFDETETGGAVEFAFDEGGAGLETGEGPSWDAAEGKDEEGFDFDESSEPAAGGDEFDFSGITFGEEESAPAGSLVEEERLAPPAQPQPALLQTEALRPQREFAAPKAAAAPLPEPHPMAPPAPRRRKSPLRALMYFIGLLLLTMVGGAIYFYWQGGIPELTNLIDRLTGQTAPTQASGQLRIEELTSFYVANPEVGQMLVIQGKAVNGYPQPRSSMTVKGILFNKAGSALLQQTVFSGNPLDPEALKKLPYAKIEESMNNPFGESLSNLNVAPGKAIPFTIVFRNLPADIAEFTVEAVDSKPGTKP